MLAHDVRSDRALYRCEAKDPNAVVAHHEVHEAAAQAADAIVKEQMLDRFHEANANSTSPCNEAPLDA